MKLLAVKEIYVKCVGTQTHSYLQPVVRKCQKKTKKQQNPVSAKHYLLLWNSQTSLQFFLDSPSSITALLTLADITNLWSGISGWAKEGPGKGQTSAGLCSLKVIWMRWLPPPNALYFSVSATGTQRNCKQIGPNLCVEMVRGGVRWKWDLQWAMIQLGRSNTPPPLLFHTDAAALHCTNWWKSDPRLFASNLPPTPHGSYHRMANTAKKQAYLERKWFGEGFVFAKQEQSPVSILLFSLPLPQSTLPEWSVSCCMV